MFYSSEHMRTICRSFAEDMTISQLCRVMKIRGINADSLTVSEIVEVVTSDEYADVLMNIACETGWNDDYLCRYVCEVDDDIYYDVYWKSEKPMPDDKIIQLIGNIVKSGYLTPFKAICDDLQIAISVW